MSPEARLPLELNEMLQQPRPRFRQKAFGVKLHPDERVLSMPNAHDLATTIRQLTPGGHYKLVAE